MVFGRSVSSEFVRVMEVGDSLILGGKIKRICSIVEQDSYIDKVARRYGKGTGLDASFINIEFIDENGDLNTWMSASMPGSPLYKEVDGFSNITNKCMMRVLQMFLDSGIQYRDHFYYLRKLGNNWFLYDGSECLWYFDKHRPWELTEFWDLIRSVEQDKGSVKAIVLPSNIEGYAFRDRLSVLLSEGSCREFLNPIVGKNVGKSDKLNANPVESYREVC